MGTGIVLAQEISLNWIRILESTEIRRWKLNHKVKEWVHIHDQVQSH